jgi:hypothetical protein
MLRLLQWEIATASAAVVLAMEKLDIAIGCGRKLAGLPDRNLPPVHGANDVVRNIQ